MTYYYKTYGISIQANVFLPELFPLEYTSQDVDLRIFFRTQPPKQATGWLVHPRFVSRRPQDQGGETWLRISESEDGLFICLSYNDGVEFILDREASNLWVNAPDELDVSYIASYMVNQVFGFILRMRGITCLHASGIIVDDQALLISAPSGYGKSTLASFFGSRGHHIITDDISALVELQGRIYVQPGYPRLRLIPETADFLLGKDNPLSMMAEGWDKLYLPLNDDKFCFAEHPIPVRAIYLLKDWRDAPEIDMISLGDAYFSLMENTYLSYLIDMSIYRHDFECIGQLLGQCLVRSLYVSPDLGQLNKTYQLILDDLKVP